MKDGWIACPLANFVTARPGNNKIIKGKESDRPSAALVQGFSASGPDVWVKTADYEQDGVVVSAVGARCGKTFLAQGKWTAIANTHVLLPGPEIDHRWLWYRTNDETFWSRGGTAQPFVKIKETLLRECEIPPLAEQRRIVAILDEAFEGIAVAKANAERKLESAREIFEVRREQVLSKDDSDWSVAPLRELCDIRHGYPFEGEFFAVEGEFVLLTPGNFHEAGGYRDRGPKQKFFVGEIPTDYVLSRGDLLVAMTEQAAGLLGSPLLVPESARFLHNQRLGRIVPRPGAVWANEFFFHVFNLRRVRGEIHASASGVKVRHTSPGKIGDVCVAYPNSLEAQRRVASRLFEFEDESDRLIACVRKKVSALDELKKSLLHQAFAGAL